MFDFYYDPARQGLDTTIWKALTGTSVITGDILRLNQDELIGYGDIKGGNHVFKLNVAAPAVGSQKIFGLFAHNIGNKAIFEIRGTKLVMVTTNKNGTTETMIDWDTALNAANASYEINLTGRQVAFKINGETQAIHDDDNYPEGPLSLYLNNVNDDSLDLVYIESRSVESYV